MYYAVIGDEHCPVDVYKTFARHRPPASCQPESRLYLQPVKKVTSEIWYTNAPMGKNTIASIAKSMHSSAGLDTKKRSNHSARKTSIQSLLHSGIPPTSVQQLSGHKNLQSLNSYSTLPCDQQRQLSNILSKSSASAEISTSSSLLEYSSIVTSIDDGCWPDEDYFYAKMGNFIDDNARCVENVTNNANTLQIDHETRLVTPHGWHVLSGVGTINGNITINIPSSYS